MTNKEKSNMIWHVWIQFIAHINFLDEWCERAIVSNQVNFSLYENQNLLRDPKSLMRHTDYCPYWPEQGKQNQSWQKVKMQWEETVCPDLIKALT